jgi:hypothetical protein
VSLEAEEANKLLPRGVFDGPEEREAKVEADA